MSAEDLSEYNRLFAEWKEAVRVSNEQPLSLSLIDAERRIFEEFMVVRKRLK